MLYHWNIGQECKEIVLAYQLVEDDLGDELRLHEAPGSPQRKRGATG